MSELINVIKDTIQAGMNHDWVSLGTGIADILAKGINVISGLIGG
ncbi:beta-class phenol-soluble modulin [Staphylococcus hyicus]|uniref:Beta-class phenol-soluble modulin n=2 Tax=Staphylococcus hyicus TaxID=1284 RepID=A0ACD5FL66_STAHY|nr:beta-class phenol-soluble modulin [Staphylococcus hyicus]AJC96447.1 putative hemolysin [Staphylococcus hyicus]MCE5153247.1 beta-class phenol-soluble modulin [Staphylococcus hyicus]MCO4328186.1 beta-class phenol-soluble modulin [Staphylococcus hyicus]MCO4330855.1 beta-class phenol-soluble modulin [Staphylococcus hyicus]MCO4334359.1 beta-class phenol-soluble modulin [Staphylococcus hyicus]